VLPRAKALALAALAGAATVAGFAPLYWFPLPVITLALQIMLWQRTAGRRDAALVGFAFGLGYFRVGVSWVYVSLHDFGAMPALLAAILTLLFCAILALYPAMTGWLYHALGTRSMLVTLAALPALWTLSEWLRGWVFTGFPWIALGYAQVPSSPLAGYVPILGVYAASFATVASASLLVTLWAQWKGRRARIKADGRNHASSVIVHPWRLLLHPSALILVSLWAGGYLLLQIDWTHPRRARHSQPDTGQYCAGNEVA
jgi:apolipoprotein N-acyltransferase